MISKNNENLTTFNKTYFDGTYLNYDSTKTNSLGLWDLLERNITSKTKIIKSSDYNNNVYTDRVPGHESLRVNLTYINSKTFNAKLILADSTIEELEFTGTELEYFFKVKRYYLLIPIPFLFIKRETMNLIGNSPEGHLIVIHDSHSMGWFLIMAGGSGGITNWKFKKCSLE